MLCDGVHIDPASGKHYILGTFSNIRVRQFPAVHPRAFSFLSVSDVHPGTHHLSISYAPSLGSPQPLVEREFESQSPLHRIILINELRDLRFEEAGNYTMEVDINGESLLVTSIGVQ